MVQRTFPNSLEEANSGWRPQHSSALSSISTSSSKKIPEGLTRGPGLHMIAQQQQQREEAEMYAAANALMHLHHEDAVVGATNVLARVYREEAELAAREAEAAEALVMLATQEVVLERQGEEMGVAEPEDGNVAQKPHLIVVLKMKKNVEKKRAQELEKVHPGYEWEDPETSEPDDEETEADDEETEVEDDETEDEDDRMDLS